MKSRLGIVEAPSIGCERIYQRHSRLCKVSGVAGDDRQVLHQRNCGDLLIEFVIGVGNAQPAPNLCGIRVEDENIFGEWIEDTRQPRFENRCLSGIVPISDQLDAAVKFADQVIADIKIGSAAAAACWKKRRTPGLAFACLRSSLITLVSIKHTRRRRRRLHPREVVVGTGGRHRHQHLDEGGRLWPNKRGGQDSPVLGLGAATMFVRPFHERPDDVVIDIPYQQVRHLTSPAGCHCGRPVRRRSIDRRSRATWLRRASISSKTDGSFKLSVDEGTAANAPLC